MLMFSTAKPASRAARQTTSRPSICCTTIGGSRPSSIIVAPRSDKATLPSCCGCASMTRPCITSSLSMEA
jgi:hypothetical protein